MSYDIEHKDYLQQLIEDEHEFTQEYLAQVYEDIKPTALERFCTWLSSIGCTHTQYTLKKYKLVRSTRESDIGTAREYQYVRLNPAQQHWECTQCGRTNKADVKPVTQQYREEHYL